MSQKEPVIILLIEDNQAHAEAVQRAFLDSGMKAEVHVARTLREYRALAAAQTPHIAIMDLNLPDGRALEALSSPPGDGPFPILLTTGFGDERVAVEAIKAGAIDYVVKSAEAFAAMPARSNAPCANGTFSRSACGRRRRGVRPKRTSAGPWMNPRWEFTL